MQALRRVLTCLLVALWLPAVVHCEMATAAGWACCGDEAAAVANDHAGDDDSCGYDVCGILEAGFIKAATDRLTVAAPLANVRPVAGEAPGRPRAPVIEPSGGVVRVNVAPPETIPLRHFVSRAALPARAPDPVS